MKLPFSDPIERLLYFSLLILFIAGGLGIAIIATQLHDQTEVLKSIQDQAMLVERHTDCVAELLSQPNRIVHPVRIQDLNNCKVGP